jgi:hypothetical protein
MNLEEFTIDKIKDYKMWYVLKHHTATSPRIVLSHQQSHMNAVVDQDEYKLFKLNNNKVLVAFKKSFQTCANYNYVASDGITEEVINLQAYERIDDHFRIGPDAQPGGGFAWSDSDVNKANPQIDWRCDNQKFGPVVFAPVTEKKPILFESNGEIEVYETILNFNGVGHLIYVKRKGGIEGRDTVFNNAPTPFVTHSLAENIKLILEWASVATPLFDNAEPIAVKARNLVEKYGITEALVAGQPDMQVYKYLSGDTSARVRPSGVLPISAELEMFIKQNVCYMTLSKLAELHPDCFNIAQVVFAEQMDLVEEWKQSLDKYGADEDIAYGDVNGAIASIEKNRPDAVMFATLYYNLLRKKSLLLAEVAGSL